MDLDLWAMDGLMDSNELHTTLIVDNELFTGIGSILNVQLSHLSAENVEKKIKSEKIDFVEKWFETICVRTHLQMQH